jgi:hypothetical protein
MFRIPRSVFISALLAMMTLSLSAFAATEDFSTATWGNHEDLGTTVTINDLTVEVPSGASMKGVTSPAAIQVGYDPTRVATSVSITPANAWDRFNVSNIVLTDLFQMPVPGVRLIGLYEGQQVAYVEAASLWTEGTGETAVTLSGFNGIDELKITGDVADESTSDIFFFIESVDYQLITFPPEIVVILNAAGDSGNTVTAAQLNAVDGVSGALAANESYYRDSIARLTADDVDTAAEIQAMVNDINNSVSSVPVADIPTSLMVIEGDDPAIAIKATDANGDELSYSLLAGSPDWLSVQEYSSYTTTLSESGTFEVNPETAVELSSARGIARDSAGNTYVAVTDFSSGFNGAVAKVATDGSISTIAGSTFFNPSVITDFEYIYAVAVDDDGNVYAADVSLKKVFKISGNTVTEFLTNVNSKGMVFADDGYLYVSNANQVLKVNTSGVVEQTFSNISDPYGLDVDSSGNIYVASEGMRVVYKVTAAGNVSVYAGIEGTRGSDDGISGTFRSPTDVKLDQSTGELYVTDATNHLIRKVATDGTVSTVAGTARASGGDDGLNAKFSNPAGLVMNASGDLIVSDKNSGRIRYLSLTDNPGITGVAPDPAGQARIEPFRVYIQIEDGFGNRIVHQLALSVFDAELTAIMNAAGDANNRVTDVQLNAVDGVTGAVSENTSKYRTALGSLTSVDVDTAEEVQALVDSANSIPVFTSLASATAIENQAFNFTFTATDSAGDALTYTMKNGVPGWLIFNAGTISGTPPDFVVGEVALTAVVSDAFGNSVEQAFTLTVLDAEIYAISSAAGVANSVTADMLNAVAGISNAVAANSSKYQSVIAGLTYSDLDSVAEIQAMVNSVNSVPQFTSSANAIAIEGQSFSLTLTATDSTNDPLTFSIPGGVPGWLIFNSATLSGTPPDFVVGTLNLTVVVSDGFGNNVEQTLVIDVRDAEINAVASVAGSANTITATELNAIAGISNAIAANDAKYQAVIAARSYQDLDTVAEIQALINSVNSVPVFTSDVSATAIEGQAFNFNFAATDSAGDALTYAVKPFTGWPAWMTVSSSGALTGTPLDENVGTNIINVRVEDGFGNNADQVFTVTVLDAEIYAVSSAAGSVNDITADDLNAVAGIDNAIAENDAKYQAAIQSLISDQLDSVEEIQAMVDSVNSVPEFQSSDRLTVNTGSVGVIPVLTSDAAGDDVTVTFKSGGTVPSWIRLEVPVFPDGPGMPLPASTSGTVSATDVPPLLPEPVIFAPLFLVAEPTAADYGSYTVTLTATDDFGNAADQVVTVIANAVGQVSIAGEVAVAETLTPSLYDNNGVDGEITYQWLSAGNEVAITENYVLQASDLGNQITLRVSYTDNDGTAENLEAVSDVVLSAEENAFDNITDQVGGSRQSADIDDYLNVGIGNVDEQTLERILPILNYAVRNQVDAEDVDTVEELEALVATIMEGQDDDCDGLPNLLEGVVDTDGDGVADRSDVDADNDGIRDNLEYGALMGSASEDDAACAMSGDSDRDGITDFFDVSPFGEGKFIGSAAIFIGLPFEEVVDENLDGVRDDRDTKDEFIEALDLLVDGVEAGTVEVAASRPIASYDVKADVDGDGLMNSLDLDADNDGVIDLVEAGFSDTDSNGLLDEGVDIIDVADDLVDTDADGTPDFLQLKSDGVTFDLVKAGIRAALDADNDGRLDSNTDVDLDGLMDVVDNAIGFFGSVEDFDGDGIPNHLDDDDDGDGIPDRDENNQYQFFTGEDADGDGIDDGIDALINGIIQGLDTNNNGVLDDRELADLDSDGIADYLDIDADGDGIRDDLDDLIELVVDEGPSQAPDLDADGDGVPDSEDVSINDGPDVKQGGAMSQAFYALILAVLAFTQRTRRSVRKLVLLLGVALAWVAPASALDLSIDGGVGFSRFDPDLQIEPTQSDTIDAGVSIGVGVHFSEQLGLTLSYFELGDAQINTARVSYEATSFALQYRPDYARSGQWGAQVEVMGSDIDLSSERGLQVDSADGLTFGFGVGADYEVTERERVELMFHRLASDVDYFSVNYRVLFSL